MTLMAAARDLPKMSFLLPSLDLDDHQTPPNTSKLTDVLRRQELRRKHHLNASGSSRERLHQMYRAPPEDTNSMCCLHV